MSKVVQIRVGGFGGQGIVLAGVLLGHAGVIDGYCVSGANSYGAQARGSACTAEVILADKPIAFPRLLEADILVAMSQGAYDRFGTQTKREGLVICDSRLVKPGHLSRPHRGIDATEVADQEMGNRQVANLVMLGALTALTRIVSRQSMESAISNHVPERFRHINLRAMERGFQLGETSKSDWGYGACDRDPRGRMPRIEETKCSRCEVCGLLCPDLCITRDQRTGELVIDNQFCERCGICVSICPKGAISIAP